MYKYRDFKKWLATPEGQVSVIRAATAFERLCTLRAATRARIGDFMSFAHCDSWNALAAIDRLVELKVLELAEDHEITQHKKYRKGPEWGR